MDDAGDLFAIGVQERSGRLGRNDVQQAALGDVAPFEVVRAHPVADDDVGALLIERGGDVGADEPGAAGDHIHVAPLGPAYAALNSLTGDRLQPTGAPLLLISLDPVFACVRIDLAPLACFNGMSMPSPSHDLIESEPTPALSARPLLLMREPGVGNLMKRFSASASEFDVAAAH